MQRREQILLIVLVSAAALWFGGGWVVGFVFGPLIARSQEYESLKEKVDAKRLEKEAVDLARLRLAGWKSRSLPPDRGVTAKTRLPTAVYALGLYQEWLTDLVQIAGLENASVKPVTQKSGSGADYVTVAVQIDAEGRFEQLCTFLDHFHRTDLLQRVARLQVDCRESEGDPVMRIHLDVEGLAFTDVPWRRTLFPQSSLAAPLDADGETLTVKQSDGFPKKTPFRVRIDQEFLLVTACEKNVWTVTRGVDRTTRSDHPVNDVVELQPLNPKLPPLSADEFRQLMASNLFVKPPPPKEYKLEIGPIAEQAFSRGQTLDFTLAAKGYDPALGRPEFLLASTPPPGLVVDRHSGKITWKPKPDQALGKFPLKIEARHPSAADGVQTIDLTVVYRERNEPPKIKPAPPQTAYLGQLWTFMPEVEDAETPRNKLTMKLGEGAPMGIAIDAATGTLKWTPGDAVKPGDFPFTVTITDDGQPPQSVALNVLLKVEDDAAQFTVFTGVVVRDGESEAWFYNRLQDTTTKLRVGATLTVANVTGDIQELGKDYLILQQGEQRSRLELGQNLRELRPAAATAARPAVKTPE